MKTSKQRINSLEGLTQSSDFSERTINKAREHISINRKRRKTMASFRKCDNWKSSSMGVMLTLGFAVLFTPPGVTWAKPKGSIYKQCACICQAPGDIIGVITDFSNTGGFSCGAYNGKTCNYSDSATGGVRSGTTKYCGPYKPGGTVAFRAPLSSLKGSVLSRGIEGDQSAEGEMEINIPAE